MRASSGISIFLLFAAAVVTGHATAAPSPYSAMQAFLDWHAGQALQNYSNPTDTPRLQSLFADELLCLLRASDRYRELHTKAAPDEKPPYADGDIFLSSAWEPPAIAEIERVTMYGRRATAQVRFTDANGTSWRDRFQLRLDGSAWRVADVDRLAPFHRSDGTLRRETPGSVVESLYREKGGDRPAFRWARDAIKRCEAMH
ncbi:hypothetical protein DBR42_14400 [Pelomonas sp. HMWF004]|nr:hypothetical protein DBR42_14400 [Pelomonas sp. HMWF004]